MKRDRLSAQPDASRKKPGVGLPGRGGAIEAPTNNSAAIDGDLRSAVAFSSLEGSMRYINDWTLIAGTVVAAIICAYLVWSVG